MRADQTNVCPYCQQCRCKRRGVAWVGLFLAGALLAGCGRGQSLTGVNDPPAVASSGSENEAKILSETLRFARQLGVKVAGELTEYEYHVGKSLAAGWYVGTYTSSGKGPGKGTAYYYRPYVLNMGRVIDGAYWESVTNVAGHETCHAETGAAHDHRHWECMARIAQPTYPDPGAGVSAQAGVGPGVACVAENRAII